MIHHYEPLSVDSERPTSRMSYTKQLHDITNNIQISRSGKKRRLLNNVDVARIANRQRKQFQDLKDTKELNANIIKIDRNIEKYQNRLIPEIQYNISKRQSMINKILNKANDNSMTIEQTGLDIKKLQTDIEIEIDQINKKFQDQLIEKNEQHIKDMESLRIIKEKEINDLNKIPPKEKLLKDIDDFEVQLQNLEQKLNALEKSNEMFSTELDERLDTEFQLLRDTKNKKLDESKKETEEIQWKLDEIKFKIQDSNFNTSVLETDIEKLNKENRILQDDINSIEKSSILPEQKLKLLNKEADEINQEYNVLLELEKLENENLDVHYDILNKDIQKRKMLQNRIDELNGHIRIFGLIEENESQLNYDLEHNSICELNEKDNKKFNFNRLYQKPNYDFDKLLSSDIKIYSNMCLQNQEDYNLFHVSPNANTDLQLTVLKFIAENYLEKYNVMFQNLSLYNEKFTNDSPFSIRENNTILLDRTPVQLIDTPSTLGEDMNDDGLIQLKVLKIQLSEKDHTERSMDFYFLQINNMQSMELLQRFLNKEEPWNTTQIGLFILKILNYTKSCFVFDLEANSAENVKTFMLPISKCISKIKNPSRK
ncbi:similar to Saccharomyces cerevisiae YPL253C VIK1 Protein that forms a complex with Kar3p at the spindle pole body [Maudiozyma saulgeensis]|uniref:Similar to Saccharomyces cerevisiae YPL253C VIK1 Protein that forms a complex with Kar3p at the spindle pole body n=1 Tax=Maudiozyma saulgeensis TaxID=1789683 RepID=A0A1X7R7H4_9SACH|nr:similar to Saccharomyces cerevisiae YPL253C VIK1 Protein that forms a complex with Kar3p at the spindle pole body [Kazachstania saulgeensis]